MEKASVYNKPIVGILIYSLTGGGAERFVSYLTPYLMNAELDVKLILMNSSVKYQIPIDTEVYYLEKSDADENNILKLLKIPFLAFKYAKLRKKLKITHSFSLLSRPNYINLLSKSFLGNQERTIISERAYPSLQYGYGGLKSKLNKQMIKLLYKKADQVICNSTGNAQDLLENFNVSKENLSVINNPIDILKINAIEPVANFFKEDTFNLITVGRLDAGKNHILLIKSVANIDNVRLYILGEGDSRNALENYINENELADKVFLLGFDANPYKYLKKADLFIFGSNHEGFPNVILEAMACGLPILSTNCKSGPGEILKLEEPKEDDIMITNCGILVPIKKQPIMTKAILYFINNPQYLESCKTEVTKRVQDFELYDILNQYRDTILCAE